MNSFTTEPLNKRRWQFWIDRGGTFTDIVGFGPDGSIRTEKLLSENPRHYADAATAGIRKILGLHADQPLPNHDIECVKIGTTVATNALLERKVAPTVLVTNKGFGDSLRIGYQNRPKIFARHIILPDQLYSRVIEIDCRVDYDGVELTPLIEEDAAHLLEDAYAAGIKSCAIVLMHSYRHPDHELKLGALARAIGFEQISLSHSISPLVKLVSRGDTTVADASLSPVLKQYVRKVQSELKDVRLLFMQSNGGLAEATHFRGKDSLLSGPAGGVVGAQAVALSAGFSNAIAFDMGGTSTDVSHIAGNFERAYEAILSGVRIKAPMIAINTVAAGGGSICYFDGFRMRVGPESAGAHPGPAAYGNGGPLTITDCNLFLGRIQAEYFPKVFGQDGNQSLNLAPVKVLIEKIRAEVSEKLGTIMTPEAVAHGLLSIANTKMSSAIKQISIEKGHDLETYALVSFGGAGGQHACQIADSLGISTIVIHPLAGVLSAYGIGTANVTCINQRTVATPLTESSMDKLAEHVTSLSQQGKEEIVKQLFGDEIIKQVGEVELRYAGTDSTIALSIGSKSELEFGFEAAHKARFGFISKEKQIVIESVTVRTEALAASAILAPRNHDTKCDTITHVKIFDQDEWKDAPLLQFEEIGPSDIVSGPTLIADSSSTIFLEQGWTGKLDHKSNFILTRTQRSDSQNYYQNEDAIADPTRLELFNHMFMSTAEQMGTALQNTSQSINIKERLDFSCAIFDALGNLVANAPHIPVHLGSMSSCVQEIIAARGNTMKPGDAYATNNPYAGGTHLPDITVVSPVFAGESAPIFFLASRGHHSDIGGITPGSMPANSNNLSDEGIVIDNFLLVRDGRFFEEEITDLLAKSPYPARNPIQNIADLKAQVAANIRGEQSLLKLCELYGQNTVSAYMIHVQSNSRSAVQAALTKLKNGNFAVTLDNNSVIKVDFQIDREAKTATLDFKGTSDQLVSNLNAPKSITNAAAMYVLRTLIDDDIPLNQGFLAALTINIPEQSFLNPKYPAAIVAGNVETSQQITDALYGALAVMAASQGTMNNFTFGNEKFQYYETICGGSGAGPDFDGANAVHTNMTNSRLTDPEILEARFPVLLEEFSIRKGSGGQGAHRGGDGVVRKIKFRDEVTASILSQRRVIAPFGLEGGSSGSPGKNYVIKVDGSRLNLGSTQTVELNPGDTFVIETPGGGGFGSARDSEKSGNI